MTSAEATKQARANKARGAGWEIDLLNGLRGQGLDVERLNKTGKDDEGDLRLRDEFGTVIIEAKNAASIDLPRYIREAMVEADNYVAHRKDSVDRQEVTAIAIVKARGQNWRKGYVVTTVAEFFDLADE